MNVLKETGEIELLIDEFKNDLYVGGAEDAVLRDKAKEIFERIDETLQVLGGNSVVSQLLKGVRKDFESFVIDVYRNRHAPELKKFYFLYKKKHP